MTTFQLLLFYGLLFIGVLLAATSAISLMRGNRSQSRRYLNRRLMLQAESNSSPGEILTLLRGGKDEATGFLKYFPLGNALSRLVRESGTAMTAAKAAQLIIGLGILWAALILVLVPHFAVLALLGPALGAVPVVMTLQMARTKRIKAFESQLPDALDLMVRSLKIGHPVSAATALVAREMADPIGSEFGIVFDAVTYGADLPTAFADLARRVPVDDLNYLAVAIQIQEESGGNLAEVLHGLSKVIRDRFRMFRKVTAITAEGRLSAWFMSIFPFFIAVFINVVKPDYYTQVADAPLFAPLAAVTVVLLLVNIVAMRILTKVEV